jgi:hypothetical protein
MTTSSAFGRPELQPFLFAVVGDSDSDGQLTVLSAMARLGLDPWQEAARLSELPRESAARALVSTFAPLPEQDWKAEQAVAIAQRLVDCLPVRQAKLIQGKPVTAPYRNEPPRWQRSGPMKWLFWAAMAVGWFMLVSYLSGPPSFEPGPTVSTSR